ncbi:MAG: hypothetical protein ACYC0F_17935 [Rhodanobacter sp.]
MAAATEAADTDDTEPEPAGPAMDEAGKPYVSGVTLEQIDELARLGDILRTPGDVVVATDQADFADVTLTIMGDAILRDAERLRDIIRAIDSMQRLDGRRRSHADVQEEAATYLAVAACQPLHDMPRPRLGSLLLDRSAVMEDHPRWHMPGLAPEANSPAGRAGMRRAQ